MTVSAFSAASRQLPIGGLWRITVSILDEHGYAALAEPDVTVFLPDGTMSALSPAEGSVYGVWDATYTVTTAGRYTARVVAPGYGAVDFTAWVAPAVLAAGYPDTDDVDNYLGEHSWTDEELQDALDAEAAAQRRSCRIPADYPDDLRQALLRRTARNLSMRRVTLSVLRSDGEGGDVTVLPGRDPEVQRFEKNYRKLGIG